MSEYDELVGKLRTYYGDDLACRMLLMDARHALEALAGEVERLTSDVDALGDNLEKVVAERDRLKAALQDCIDAYDFVIVDEYDRGWSSVSDAIHAARKALRGDAS